MIDSMSNTSLNKSEEVSKLTTEFAFRPISPSTFCPKIEDSITNNNFKSKVGTRRAHSFNFSNTKKSGKEFTFQIPTTFSNKDFINTNKRPIESILNEKKKLETDLNLTNLYSNDDDKDKKPNNNDDKIEETKSEEEINIKTLFKEFKGIINEFIKERVESEKKIITLENRITTLEKEIDDLKYKSEILSSTISKKETGHSVKNSSTMTATNQSASLFKFSLASINPNSKFDSTSPCITSGPSVFGSNQTPTFDYNKSPLLSSSPLFGTTTPVNFEIKKTVFLNNSSPNQTSGSKLFKAETSNNDPMLNGSGNGAMQGGFNFKTTILPNGINNGSSTKLFPSDTKSFFNINFSQPSEVKNDPPNDGFLGEENFDTPKLQEVIKSAIEEAVKKYCSLEFGNGN